MERARISSRHVVYQFVWADVAAFLFVGLLENPSIHARVLILRTRVLGSFEREFTAALEMLRSNTKSRLSCLRILRIPMLHYVVGTFPHGSLFLLMRYELGARDRMMTQCSHLLALRPVLQKAHRILLPGI